MAQGRLALLCKSLAALLVAQLAEVGFEVHAPHYIMRFTSLSTPNDFFVRYTGTMSKLDPDTAARRERFRAYCRGRGWENPDGTWMVTAIATATGKPRTKISNLLNATGSFGAGIARELEAALDLRKGYLDGLCDGAEEWPFAGVLTPQEYASLPEEGQKHIRSAAEMVAKLYLRRLGELSRSKDDHEHGKMAA
jgi:hypothetical protein